MNRHLRTVQAMAAVASLALVSSATAQIARFTPTVDGTRDSSYGSAIAVQTTQTEYGDATTGTLDTGGSELDALFAARDASNLYIMAAGNLEENGNILWIFIDNVAETGGFQGAAPALTGGDDPEQPVLGREVVDQPEPDAAGDAGRESPLTELAGDPVDSHGETQGDHDRLALVLDDATDAGALTGVDRRRVGGRHGHASPPQRGADPEPEADDRECDAEADTDEGERRCGAQAAVEQDAYAMPFGEFPVLVISATQADEGGVENQAHWLAISPNSEQVEVEGPHDLHVTNPDETSAPIVDLISGL